MAGFVYQDPFALGKDETKFRLLEGSNKYVSVETFNGQEVLKIQPEGIKELANKAMRELLLQPGYIRIEKPLISDDQVLWVAAGGVGLVLLMLIGWRLHRKRA